MDDERGESSRPVTLTLAGIAAVGWLIAAGVWWQSSQTQSQLNDSLTAAEQARESLASDLQNLQKTAGTAADLKKQATDAEKALSEASAARASAQNELADLTKQISDAKLAISGAQEEASAKTRDLQAVDARLKDETDHVAALQSQDQALAAEQSRLQGEVDAARTRSRRGPDRDRRRAKGVRGPAGPDQRGDRRAQRPPGADSRREATPEFDQERIRTRDRPGRPRRVMGAWEIVRRGAPCLNIRTGRQASGVAPGTIADAGDFMDELVATDKPAPQAAELRPYTAAELKAAVLAKLTYAVGKTPEVASPRDWFLAVTFATRDIVVDRWLEFAERRLRRRAQARLLSFARVPDRTPAVRRDDQSRHREPMAEALDGLGVNLADLRRLEPDAALGNGGLGRLAACFMDSMATLSIAAHGYGIRYDNGLFRQIIRGGWQQETPEDWLVNGNPWEFDRPEYNYAIGFGGWVEMIQGDDERTHHVWHPAETVEAVGYDTPIVGWRGRHVNTLRLWSARAPDPFKLDAFNAGDYVGAFSETVRARGDLEGALPERRHAGRPGIAAQAGIFLRFRFAARSHPPPHQAVRATCARSASTPRSSSTTPIRRSPSPN